ncbi:Isoflavone reductase-like protein [Hapsidospora chrysogenum ATCC 11550]|uniref:Isoflavone reductase-like protein n=1 Tax=Hapsidospora chrysogenum (strain ATCC 11550 / CBS 779.69 / DSM 880 / IAM 14645 / JCM 23072 / IMI 49137) TaxID=857340 RepID=A0A086TBS3_HAPC1|nr:Isoflavone reductase-like protein [Hapsidospora chrysogenum ATCC 11550]
MQHGCVAVAAKLIGGLHLLGQDLDMAHSTCALGQASKDGGIYQKLRLALEDVLHDTIELLEKYVLSGKIKSAPNQEFLVQFIGPNTLDDVEEIVLAGEVLEDGRPWRCNNGRPASLYILIIGATGNIGKYITNSVVQSKPSFPKIIVFTSPATASSKHELIEGWKASGVSIKVGDVTNPADIGAAYHGIEMIKIAEESESVQWFFPSGYGTDIEHNPRSRHEKPHLMKLAVCRHIREHARRLKVTYVVVGPYFEMWVGAGNFQDKLGGFDIATKQAAVIGDGEVKIGFTTMPDTGKVAVAALQHPEAPFNKALKTSAKLYVKHIPLAEVEGFGAQMYEEGHPFSVVSTLRRIRATGGTLYDTWDNGGIGLDSNNLESLEVDVQRHV